MSIKAEDSDKNSYKFISAVGADWPFSNGTNKLSLIIYADCLYYFNKPKDMYGEIGANNATVFATFGIDNKKFNTGIKPIWGYIIYGACSDYDKGYSSKKNEISGNFIGTEFFFIYNWSKFINSSFIYFPNYYYYKTENNANLKKPDSHWEHNIIIQLQYKNLNEKNLGIIKHGISAKARYNYIYRVNYSFQDRIMPDGTIPEISDEPSSHKYYLDLGAYYNFMNDYNIKFEVLSSLQFNTDRNNAEKIGSIIAGSAVMPGYFFAEFYHDRYIISNLKFGIPLNYWQARIEPGYNILYMPEDNKVIGVPDYPRKYYRSVSLSLTLRILNLLPMLIDYGYGIDAERRHKQNGSIKKGSHEVRTIIAFAFGNYNK